MVLWWMRATISVNGTGSKIQVEALAHSLSGVLVALEPERAAECIEEALIDEDMSPGACLALRVVLKEESLLCSADDEAPRLAYRSIVKLAQALDEDRAPQTCGEVGIGLLRCLTQLWRRRASTPRGELGGCPRPLLFSRRFWVISRSAASRPRVPGAANPPQIAIEDLLNATPLNEVRFPDRGRGVVGRRGRGLHGFRREPRRRAGVRRAARQSRHGGAGAAGAPGAKAFCENARRLPGFPE